MLRVGLLALWCCCRKTCLGCGIPPARVCSISGCTFLFLHVFSFYQCIEQCSCLFVQKKKRLWKEWVYGVLMCVILPLLVRISVCTILLAYARLSLHILVLEAVLELRYHYFLKYFKGEIFPCDSAILDFSAQF